MTRTLVDFLGSYTLERRIVDRKAATESRFEGKAVISKGAEGALYQENGHLILAGQRFEAERTYLWRETGGRIFVSFADGRAFHDFDPVKGGDATRHLCGEDWYLGGYDMEDWPRWRVTWEVSGPRKDYTSITDYRPISEDVSD